MKIENGKEFVFDSYALIGYLKNEIGAEIIEDFLKRAGEGEIRVYLNEINLGEVYYIIWKKRSEKVARESLAICLNFPLIFVLPNHDFILKAAELKSRYNISYADAFCLQTAIEKKCPIVTGDPEFFSVPHVKIIKIRK